jgi:hypothetical protein
MTDAPAQGLGLLAKLVIAAAATLVIAGIVWHGIALDNFQRMWSDLIDRPSGPMAFRFILQPSMAAITATRDGLRDARTERSPYLWTIVRQSEERVALHSCPTCSFVGLSCACGTLARRAGSNEKNTSMFQ